MAHPPPIPARLRSHVGQPTTQRGRQSDMRHATPRCAGFGDTFGPRRGGAHAENACTAAGRRQQGADRQASYSRDILHVNFPPLKTSRAVAISPTAVLGVFRHFHRGGEFTMSRVIGIREGARRRCSFGSTIPGKGANEDVATVRTRRAHISAWFRCPWVHGFTQE